MKATNGRDVDAYGAIGGIHWTCLKEMRRSPKHYKWRLENPIEPTWPMKLGLAVHTAVLESDRFPLDYAVFKGPRRAGKEWEAFELANAGRTILKVPEYEMCLAIRNAVRRHPIANHLLEVGEAEKVLTWTDERTGLDLKGRVDWFNGYGLVDLKTTADVDPRWFGMTAARQGYHAQLAFYRRGLHAQQLDAPAKILAVESEPPHDVIVYSLSEDDLAAGDREIDALLARVVECTRTNVWPGRCDGDETPLQLPAWALCNPDLDPTGLGLVIAGAEV